ncbi:MAG: hypothetical protein HY510_07145 [Acidobacteria bacterium]|nr:hypothetical protein [Acidobacteriota bacterium]
MSRDRLCLLHMRDAIQQVIAYTKGGKAAFLHFGVDHRLVWDVVEQRIPELQKAVEALLSALPET